MDAKEARTRALELGRQIRDLRRLRFRLLGRPRFRASENVWALRDQALKDLERQIRNLRPQARFWHLLTQCLRGRPYQGLESKGARWPVLPVIPDLPNHMQQDLYARLASWIRAERSPVPAATHQDRVHLRKLPGRF